MPVSMPPFLRDLLDHHAWADAESWRSIEAFPAASEDQAIRARLHHLHIVQQGFAWAVGDRTVPFTMTRTADFPTFDALKAFARRVHGEFAGSVARLDDEALEAPVAIPWFTEPPLAITRTQALTQAAMHSQWHRGQNAARLRELGGTPPTLDIIVWYWKGKPAAKWSDG